MRAGSRLFRPVPKIGSGQGKAFPSAPYHPPIRKNGKVISDAAHIRGLHLGAIQRHTLATHWESRNPEIHSRKKVETDTCSGNECPCELTSQRFGRSFFRVRMRLFGASMDNDKRLSVELAAAKKPMRHPSAPDFPRRHRGAKHAHVAATVYRSHDNAAFRQGWIGHWFRL